jgi:hypothetical protein
MPKLPANYVKAPSFDNPLRATADSKTSFERSLQLQLDEATWSALTAFCQAEGLTPEAVALQAIARHLEPVKPSAIAPSAPVPPQPSKRAQLMDQLYEQFVRRSWVQCVLTMRAILREARA